LPAISPHVQIKKASREKKVQLGTETLTIIIIIIIIIIYPWSATV